ncbi:MAG TPA: hypothetical protein VK745_27725 [Polyangiaceae bacterium]|jgi:hypothetical protein|nr:hypothetical protein [Polyangiaceae bacterium]
MATKKVSDPKKPEQRSIADVLYQDFENLPGEFRVLLNKHSATPSTIGSVAVGLNDVLGEIRGNLSGDEFRRAATLVRAYVAHATQALFELQCFAGALDGLAWAVDAKWRAEAFVEP